MNTKKYFPGFNGLRFISISFVILSHLLTFKTNFGFTEYTLPISDILVHFGTQFFFAGSGFLITYLLLVERQKNNRISLKDFYARRILRIWPAYFLLIFLALIIVLKMPFFRIPGLTDAYLQTDYQKGNLLHFLFLPHIVPFLFPTVPYVHQTYTIGIEEQFYFLWGLLFCFIPRLNKKIFLTVILIIMGANFIHDVWYDTGNINTITSLFFKTSTFVKYSHISTFALGALFAFAFIEEKKWLHIFKSKAFQVLFYIGVVLCVCFQFTLPYFNDEFVAMIMLITLGIAIFKETSIINYDAPWLSFLGKISYGIYLFHVFAIVFAAKMGLSIFNFKTETPFIFWILFAITMLLSILFGFISFYAVESFFLKLKKRFQKV